MSWNWIDVVLLVIIGFSTIRGLFRGLIRSVFDLLALFAAIFAAFTFQKNLTVALFNLLKLPEGIVNILSFVIIWLIAFIIVSIIGNLIHRLIGATFLAPLNILGGGIFGVLKGALVVWLALQIILALPLPTAAISFVESSIAVKWSLPLLKQTQPFMKQFMPKELPDIQRALPDPSSIKI